MDRSLVVGVTAGISAIALLRGQLAWFREQGWKVTLVADDDPQSRIAADREGVEYFPLPMERQISLKKDMVSLWRWIKFLWKVKPQAVNLGTPKAALLGMIAAWILRVPRRLYTVRGLRLEGVTGLSVVILWIMEWITMRLATDVLFISSSLAEECRRRKIFPPGKTWLNGHGSSNGVNGALIQDKIENIDRKSLRDRIGIAEDAFVVGFVGRVNKDKGVDVIISSLKQKSTADNVVALFVGPCEDSLLEEEISNFGDKIIMLGWKDDVSKYYKAMDVLCLPSRREGFGNVVLEAAVAGVPAIVTNATGVRDSIIPNETGMMIDIDDSEKLAEIVSMLKANRDLLARLGESAKQRAIRDFKPEDIWFGLNEILTGVSRPTQATRI